MCSKRKESETRRTFIGRVARKIVRARRASDSATLATRRARSRPPTHALVPSVHVPENRQEELPLVLDDMADAWRSRGPGARRRRRPPRRPPPRRRRPPSRPPPTPAAPTESAIAEAAAEAAPPAPAPAEAPPSPPATEAAAAPASRPPPTRRRPRRCGTDAPATEPTPTEGEAAAEPAAAEAASRRGRAHRRQLRGPPRATHQPPRFRSAHPARHCPLSHPRPRPLPRRPLPRRPLPRRSPAAAAPAAADPVRRCTHTHRPPAPARA